MEIPSSDVNVWSEDTLIGALHGEPKLFRGFDDNGARIPFEQEYPPYEWSEFSYLTGSIRSFLAAVERAVNCGLAATICGRPWRWRSRPRSRPSAAACRLDCRWRTAL